jgi:hypothetical protein
MVNAEGSCRNPCNYVFLSWIEGTARRRPKRQEEEDGKKEEEIKQMGQTNAPAQFLGPNSNLTP